MVLNCKHVWAQISDYIESDVAPELREAIEEHLAHCRHCAAVLDSVGYSDRLQSRLQEEIASSEQLE